MSSIRYDKYHGIVRKRSASHKRSTLFAPLPSFAHRVQTLICVHAFLKALDTTTMTQKLLPILRMPRGSDPAVLVRAAA